MMKYKVPTKDPDTQTQHSIYTQEEHSKQAVLLAAQRLDTQKMKKNGSMQYAEKGATATPCASVI